MNAGIPRQGGSMTFEQIAAEMGVSRQRVHRIYEIAMAKLVLEIIRGLKKGMGD